jgi:hypothetical protein
MAGTCLRLARTVLVLLVTVCIPVCREPSDARLYDVGIS